MVIATRDGNLVLAAQPQVDDQSRAAIPYAANRSDADLDTVARTTMRGSTADSEPRRAGARRFVSRAVIADAVRTTPRIDAARFRADLDALSDPHV